MNLFVTLLKELNLFFMTQRIEPFFFTWLEELNLLLNMTQRREPLLSLKYDLRKYDSKNWHLFFFSMAQRIEPSFFTWLNELNLLFSLTRGIALFFVKKYDSKNWTFLHDSKNWTFFSTNDSKNWIILTQKNWIFFFLSKIRLKELNPFSTWLKDFV